MLVVPLAAIQTRAREKLIAAGASVASAEAATRAMMHASIHGVDSHGVRLTQYYCEMLAGGRIKSDPFLKVERRAAAAATVDADCGLGHYASYHAIETGCAMAREVGAATIGVMDSEHFGAAGAYALAGAEAGFVTFATTNSDSRVGLHEGAARFHGTNPLAFAAPVPGERPWLFDMATSSISMNRVLLHRTLGKELLPGVAADVEGVPTVDPNRADILIPVGGLDYGYKGAGLAGVATILSGVLMGMTLDADFIPMYGSSDISTSRGMGHFFFILDPEKFAGAAAFGNGMKRYLASLRAAPARPGATVMAPGDREWAVADKRRREGIPIDSETANFLGINLKVHREDQ